MSTALSDTAAPATSRDRALFAVNAASAWFGVTASFILTVTRYGWQEPPGPSSYGWNPAGAAGIPSLVFDFFSYFTILSNIVVGIVATMLAANPRRDGRVFRVLRLDSLLMITVTGLIYGVVLAPLAKTEGLQWLSNGPNHYITPIITIVVWVIAGPRGWIAPRTVLLSLILPIAWAAFILARGAVINAYPYFFIDVAKLGYPTTIINIVGIAVFGIAIGFAYYGIDRLLSRRQAARA